LRQQLLRLRNRPDVMGTFNNAPTPFDLGMSIAVLVT
jgi:hypothetical protein